MRSPHAATALAGALIVIGVVLLFFGWKGAAATLFIPTQVAYGISGSVAGVAVMGVGLSILVVQTTRMNTARRTRDMQRLVADGVGLLAVVRDRTAGGTRRLQRPAAASSASATATLTRAPLAAPESTLSSNGHGTSPDHRIFRPDVLVVPGAKIFHAPGCRILAGNDRALHLTIEEAEAAGLRPCRICAPTD